MVDTLWRRDRDSVWALNTIWRSRRGSLARRPSLGWHRVYGRAIQVVAPKLPYGWACGKGVLGRTVTHIPELVMLIWRGGQYRGAGVIWKCGGRSTEFELLDHPLSDWVATSPGRRVIPMCWICEHHNGTSVLDTSRAR